MPILLIGTRYDPNTGYANALRSEQLLGNAVLLTQRGLRPPQHQGHQPVRRAVAGVRYLVDLETPAPGTVCAADRLPFS